MKRKYETILFDMDGTLADSDPMLVKTFNDLYDKYKGGKRRPPEEIYYFSGPPIRETLKKEFPELDLDFIFKEFHDISYSYYNDYILPYEHSKEVLHKLKKDGFKLGVVTNKQHNLTIVALKVIDLEDVFDVIVGLNDVSKGKPDKEGILKAIDSLGGDIKTALYVGDNAVDLESANNAGIDCCLVNWGPRVLGKDVVPTFKINSYLELEEKLYE